MKTTQHFIVEETTDEKRWDKLVRNSLFPSFRQNYAYVVKRNKKKRGTFSFIFIENGVDVAAVQYSTIKSKYNLLSTADIIPGFVFRVEPNESLLSFMVEHFLIWAKKEKASYSRVHPWLPGLINGEMTPYLSLFEKVFKQFGFDIIKEGPGTYWLDLSHDEEELLKKMNRKTRYEVRQGLKSKIQIEKVVDPNNNIIEQFWDLYKLLGENKGFKMYSEAKFKEELKLLLQERIAIIFVAKFIGEIVNFSIASNFGIVSYLHGSINPEFKKLDGCPSPGQLVQWSMLTEMKNRGAKMYDMGFCPGPIPEKNHPAYNIWRFKYGFGGTHVQFLPVFGKTIHPIKGRIFKQLKKS